MEGKKIEEPKGNTKQPWIKQQENKNR